MMVFYLIPASAYTLEALTELYNRARADYLVPMPMTPETMASYLARHDVDASASLVAELDGQPAGLALLGLRGARAWITRMGVTREARRAGVGRALVEGLLDSARAGGADSIQLEVIADNAIGQRLFRAIGFQPARRLLMLERPPGWPDWVGPVPDRTLSTPEARDLLETAAIGYAPSWVEEAPSLRRARRLAGIGFNQAALVYGDDGTVLSPLALCGADEVTGPALLAAFHQQRPDRPAQKENIPEDDPQAGWFAVAGYRVAFTRVEMRRTL